MPKKTRSIKARKTRVRERHDAVYYIVTGDIYSIDSKGEMLDWLKKNTTAVRQYTGINLFKRN